MARATAGLTPRHAALLLRCQQLRKARLQGDAARCTVEHAAAGERAHAAQLAADGHAAEAAAALRRGYDELVGHGSSLPAINTLRAREARSCSRQARLTEVALTAQERVAQAAVLEAAARERLVEAACNVARRERLFETASRNWARSRAALEEARSEDGHAALHAWRR